VATPRVRPGPTAASRALAFKVRNSSSTSMVTMLRNRNPRHAFAAPPPASPPLLRLAPSGSHVQITTPPSQGRSCRVRSSCHHGLSKSQTRRPPSFKSSSFLRRSTKEISSPILATMVSATRCGQHIHRHAHRNRRRQNLLYAADRASTRGWGAGLQKATYLKLVDRPAESRPISDAITV